MLVQGETFFNNKKIVLCETHLAILPNFFCDSVSGLSYRKEIPEDNSPDIFEEHFQKI